MEKTIGARARKTLERLGLRVARKVGRPPRGLEPGEEIWTVTVGPTAAQHQVLATPFRDGAQVTGRGKAIDLPRLWVAEYLPRVTAERMIAAGAALADTVGNAHLQLPGIVIHVLGNEPPSGVEVPAKARPRRAWRGPAIRAVFELLRDPALVQQPFKELAVVAGTTPGTITFLLQDLERTGHLIRLGGHARRFVPDQSLVEYWIGEYERKLHPKLGLGVFHAADGEWWRDFDVVAHNAVWGGEMAAHLLGADLKPSTRTLYADRDDFPQLLKQLRLRADPDGDVEIRHRFWYPDDNGPHVATAFPLLVAADLRILGDARCRAAARDVLERYVVGPIEGNDG